MPCCSMKNPARQMAALAKRYPPRAPRPRAGSPSSTMRRCDSDNPASKPPLEIRRTGLRDWPLILMKVISAVVFSANRFRFRNRRIVPDVIVQGAPFGRECAGILDLGDALHPLAAVEQFVTFNHMQLFSMWRVVEIDKSLVT